MKHIVYLSTAVNLMTEIELEDILKVAQKNNTTLNVTGVLLYSGGTFIQVLEGMPQDVDHQFDIIERDLRHKNIIVIINEPLKDRNFPHWSMGYSSLNAERGKELIGYLKSTDDIIRNNRTDSVFSILKTFINTNKLMIRL